MPPGSSVGVQRIVDLARRHLDMDLAYLAEFTDGKQVYRGLAGDAESFHWELNDGPALEGTYCRLMTAAEMPNAIPDARASADVRDLALTRDADIGSYVGVPVTLDDGTLYGSLCCVSHQASPVDDKDVKFLRLLAELLVDELQADRALAAQRAELAEVIEARQIQMALQPIADVVTGRLVGVEALARFPTRPGRPDLVFAAAHSTGLGLAMERLAGSAALRLLPLLPDDVYLAVNLTAETAIELMPYAYTFAHKDGGFPYHRLVLEITEHSAVQNYSTLRHTLRSARDRGLRLAIDDAGAGYASLQHIVELQPDIIKIDRSLTDGMSTDSSRRAAVAAFVALARHVDATLVAEGVEEHADLDLARQLGVHTAQGYLLARPTTDRQALTGWLTNGLTPAGSERRNGDGTGSAAQDQRPT